MTDPKERAASLALKLLRTAAPKSGASENERQIAALKAAELVAEHDLIVAIAEKKPKRRRAPTNWTDIVAQVVRDFVEQQQPETTSARDWHEVVAEEPYPCASCGDVIQRGDLSWFAEGRGHIHFDITCAESATTTRRAR